MTEHLALAVDVGGTKIESALITSDGSVVAGSRHRRATGRTLTPDEFTVVLDACAQETLAAAATVDGAEIIGAGIGSAGPIDLASGRIRPKNLPLLHGFPLRSVIERHVGGRPVSLRLDGTCIALAEQWIGANRGAESSMSMVVSTGVGGGIILDGRIWSGRSGNAGHIGQLHIQAPEDGADGTLESIAAGPSSVAWARLQGWTGNTGEELGRADAGGDAIATAAIRRSAVAVGTAIANVATLLDITDFAIGGGFSSVTPGYLDIVRGSARAHAIFDYSENVEIRASGLGSEGPLIGAAALVHNPRLLGEVPVTA